MQNLPRPIIPSKLMSWTALCLWSSTLLGVQPLFWIHLCVLVAQPCLTVCDPMDCSPPGFFLCNSPGKNTRVGCHFLLQGIFLTQGLNPGLLYCRQMLYHSSSPREALSFAIIWTVYCSSSFRGHQKTLINWNRYLTYCTGGTVLVVGIQKKIR